MSGSETSGDISPVEMRELLSRARDAISNLRAVASRQHRYNKVTAENSLAVLNALNDAIRPSARRGCFVVVERCEGYTAKCRCGWEQHHGSKFAARDDATEHELNGASEVDGRA